MPENSISLKLLLVACCSCSFVRSAYAVDKTCDVVVYGGTSAGVIAAVQAKKMGKSVVLVCPETHLGGLSSGGLGWTDTGDKRVIGGLSRDFYHRVWRHYQLPEAWKWQKAAEYGNQGQGSPAIDGAQRTMWIFEPHVAEAVFEDLIREYEIPVVRNQWLDRSTGVVKQDRRITSMRTQDGSRYYARVFIDATYEGDLMATANVSYHVGRESTMTYGEKWNGVQVGVLHHRHHFGALQQPISPYVVPGNPASGLLPNVSRDPPGTYGDGDKRVQAYCFRTCLTQHDPNRIPFPKPDGYDAQQYELLLRIFEAGWRETYEKFDPIPNHKTDTNNHGPFSSDYLAMNYDYPEASYERRREIIAEHRRYQQGLLYFMANDPRVPVDVRESMSRWGLSKDEFVDNGNWPHQLYIREARRMVGSFVMTENELLKRKPTPESIGMGSYTIDSHNVRRYVTADGHVQNEGDIGVPTKGPYEIAYRAITPQAEECTNLLVPVCVSSSHIAFGSIRMEPVFMILGQSAATAGVLAIDGNMSVQDVPYASLRQRLLNDGQVLQAEGQSFPEKLAGVVVDDSDAVLIGNWKESGASRVFVGDSYRHDNKSSEKNHQATFTGKLPKAGRYEVRFGYPANANRASNVTVEIVHAQGRTTKMIDQRITPPIDGMFVTLGVFEFPSGDASVIVSNRNADGYVVIDAVQWIDQ